MLTPALLIGLALCTTVIHADIYFVNPPRSGATGDFSSNVVYTVGQNLRVQWSEAPEGVGISVLLYQLNATTGDYFLPGQYLFQNVVNTTLYDWTVVVSDNLPHTISESNLFYLSIFQEGKRSSDDNSHYFNINQAKPTTTSETSTTTTTSASTSQSTNAEMASSIFPASTTSLSPSATSEPTTTQEPPPSPATGMSTGAKIGIGVGIPAAAIIGIGAGWLFFGRRRRQSEKGASIAAGPQETAATMGPSHGAGASGVPEFWGQGNYHYEALSHSKQTPPPRQHFGPPVYEASGESRAMAPAELYTEAPDSREHPGHPPDSMRSY